MEDKLLNLLKEKARQLLENNTRFHCYAHALEFLENVGKLLALENEQNFDETVLYAAALFHDASNNQTDEVEGIEGAEIAEKLLLEIEIFPKDKITEVKRLIKSTNEHRELTLDETILNTADEMAAFSNLGLVRSFMISGSKGMKVKDALEWELGYLDKRFNKFKLQSAQELVKEQYKERQKFLLNSLSLYKS